MKAVRRGTGLLAAVGAAAVVTALTVPAAAAPASASAGAHGVHDPYSPAYGHAYRHGVLPTVAVHNKMKAWASQQGAATSARTLAYGGGVDGIGVQSGHSKVYLVFYGTQWGTSTTDANGNLKFSGDSYGAAGAAQQMFRGIGTNNELWSADLTQWCDGAGVATGATSCPASGANYIPYQSGGVLAGVWYDNTQASPASATSAQLGQEAVSAAGHFGNTTAAANRYAYYVILSPHGTNPDNYQSPTQGYCAWHDWNGDVGVSSPYGDLAFSNQPYNIDLGASCGTNFVNSGSAGMTDGYTITLGHEWHEMMSDQNPAGGWTNRQTTSSYYQQENSDECAWISPGQTGGAANVSFGSYGSYAEQASWSNDTNSCAISHPIVSHGTGGNTVTVTNPGNQTGTVGTAKSLQISASDSGGATLTYSATGLPTGLSINASTGLISGTPTTAGTFSNTVTASDSTGASGSASFSWTISPSGTTGCSSPGQKLSNPGFESGSTGWTATSGVINTDGAHSHSGTGYAWLDGYGTTHTDTLSHAAVTIPAGCSATLTYYLYITTNETTTTTAYDKLSLTVNGTAVQSFSNLNHGTGYVQRSVNLSSYAGQSVTVKWTGTEDSSLATNFFIDDTALTVS